MGASNGFSILTGDLRERADNEFYQSKPVCRKDHKFATFDA